jgi:tocopherol O-methyltransferase
VTQERALALYYDRLTRWTTVARPFWSGGRDRLSVHRALADPDAGGAPTSGRLHALVARHAADLTEHAGPLVLDAGCGLGGTMIELAGRLGGRYVGLTLSPRQAAVARDALARAGLASRARVEVRSYDDPPPGPFDLVLAIESLAHSTAPDVSLAALARVLAPGGMLIVVDDMPEVEAGDADLETFRRGWQCPVLWNLPTYEQAIEALGLRLVASRDLTPECRTRSLERLAVLERVTRAAARVVPSGAWRVLMASHLGGLALERLYRRGAVRYRLLVARR